MEGEAGLNSLLAETFHNTENTEEGDTTIVRGEEEEDGIIHHDATRLEVFRAIVSFRLNRRLYC